MDNNQNKVRLNILRVIVYIIAIILLIQLFNLQIVNGAKYRETSNTRLTREATLKAARGYMYDTNNTILAGVEMAYCLQMYRSKIDIETLNNGILNMIKTLEKNGDSYIDSFPIQIEPFRHTYKTEEEFLKWKKEFKIEEKLTPEEVFYLFKEKYKINNEDLKDIKKIIAIRYEIETVGYSATKPLIVSQNISKKSVLEISEKGTGLPSINIMVQPLRNYPNGKLASHVLGYIGKSDYVGKMGIEALFEEYLKGQDGIKQIDMDVDGGITEEFIYKEAIAGSNITLTIDSRLQKVAEDALKANIEKIKAGGFSKAYDAKAGTVIVMNVKTGEVIAMANYPDFEPQEFVNGISNQKWNEYESTNALFNRAIQENYSPGSIFKMVTAMAGLENGVIGINERIITKGKYPYAHNPVCWLYTETGRNHGTINVAQGLKYSCNYVFYEIGRRLGIEELEKYAKYFRLGSKTGIELPGEVAGSLATRENLEKTGETWKLGNTLSAVIGQGQNSFTPIQIVRYISMIANGGKVVNPTLIKNIVNSEGTEISKDEINNFVNNKLNIKQEEVEQVSINEQNIKKVLEGMLSVTKERDGTAYGAFHNFEQSVGGKTGSAEAGTQTNAWFASFAPYEDPEIAVVVMVENGNKGSYTAEVARKIMDEYFNYKGQEIQENIEAKPYINL